MLASLYFLMKGTPFIYQGQEIGMTNVQFPSIEDYNDVGMVNYYRVEREKGRSHEELMKLIWKQCRDNSRTPMQWNASSDKAGFTSGDSTWLGVNPNYVDINVEAQLGDPDSILSFYKQLIRLRKDQPVFVYGTYELMLANHPKLFAYTRKWGKKMALVVNNFSEEATRFRVPGSSVVNSGGKLGDFELVLANYEGADRKLHKEFNLQPYETRVYILR